MDDKKREAKVKELKEIHGELSRVDLINNIVELQEKKGVITTEEHKRISVSCLLVESDYSLWRLFANISS